jgi:hypothetical protein
MLFLINGGPGPQLDCRATQVVEEEEEEGACFKSGNRELKIAVVMSFKSRITFCKLIQNYDFKHRIVLRINFAVVTPTLLNYTEVDIKYNTSSSLDSCSSTSLLS